jgi:hypothetical protein
MPIGDCSSTGCQHSLSRRGVGLQDVGQVVEAADGFNVVGN